MIHTFRCFGSILLIFFYECHLFLLSFSICYTFLFSYYYNFVTLKLQFHALLPHFLLNPSEQREGSPTSLSQEACQSAAELLQRRRLLHLLRLPLEHNLGVKNGLIPDALLDSASVCLMPYPDIVRLSNEVQAHADSNLNRVQDKVSDPQSTSSGADAGQSSAPQSGADAGAPESSFPSYSSSGIRSVLLYARPSDGLHGGAVDELRIRAHKFNAGRGNDCNPPTNPPGSRVFLRLPLLQQLRVLRALRSQLSAQLARIPNPAASQSARASRHAQMAVTYVTSQRTILKAALSEIADIIGRLLRYAIPQSAVPQAVKDTPWETPFVGIGFNPRVWQHWQPLQSGSNVREVEEMSQATSSAHASQHTCVHNSSGNNSSSSSQVMPWEHPPTGIHLGRSTLTAGEDIASAPLQQCFIASHPRLLALQLASASLSGHHSNKWVQQYLGAAVLPPAARLAMGDQRVQTSMELLEGEKLPTSLCMDLCFVVLLG